MYGSNTGRVFLLRRFPAGMVAFLKNSVIAIAFGWIAYVQFYTKIKESLEDQFTKVHNITISILAISTLIATAFVSWASKKTKIDIWFLDVRRSLVKALTVSEDTCNLKKSIARYLFNIPLLHGKIKNEAQEKFINSVFEVLLDENQHGARFLVEGKPSSGKTTSILILIRKISLHASACKYANSIFYFDLAQNSINQNQLFQRLDAGEFSNKIVIIDNFHRIQRNVLRCYTQHFLNSKCATDICSIFLSHPTSGLAANPETDIALVKEIKSKQRFFQLGHLEILSGYTQFHPSLLDGTQEEVHRLHLISMCDRKQSSEHFKRILSKEEVTASKGRRKNHKAALLASIVALSLFRGGFTRGEFVRVLRHLRKENDIGFIDSLALRIGLAEYARCGIVFKVVTSWTYYIFHAKLARSIRRTYCGEASFEHYFNNVITLLADESQSNGRDLDTWLYASEIQQSTIKGIGSDLMFSRALLSGQYQYMLDSLRQITANGAESIYSRELGVLYELIGKREKAQQYFKQAFSKKFSTLLRFNHLEYEHTTNLPPILEWLEKQHRSGDRLFRLMARFWTVHINIHLGYLMLDELWEMVDELAQCYDEIGDDMPYEKAHLLRRAYFDIYRIAYLTDDCNSETMNKLKNHKALHWLADNHPLYYAYCKKTIDANHGHYCTIFNEQFSILKSMETEEKTVKYHGNTQGNINIILDHYANAVKEFEYFGDKASKSLKLRIAEVKLMLRDREVDAIIGEIYDYYKYAHGSGIQDFIGNAQSILAKAYFQKAMACLAESLSRHDAFMKEALHNLDMARASYASVGNQYGITRSEILYGLLKTQVDSNANPFINTWSARVSNLRCRLMHREADLIEFSEQYGVSPALIAMVFTYYPIVIQ